MAQKWITAAALRAGVLEWTVLKVTKDRVEAQGVQRETLFAPGVAPDFASADLAAKMRVLARRMPGNLCLGVSAPKALLRVVDVPTKDPEEIRGMVGLQVDKISPFPVDNMAVSFEVLASTETQSRILMAAIQREETETWGRVFLKAGLIPHRMDVDVMGWYELIRGGPGILEQGRQLLLIAERDGLELIILQDGQPILFRSLGSAQGLSPEEFAAEVADEMAYTLTSLEAEWGGAVVTQAALWRWNDAPVDDLAARLRDACGIEVAQHPLDDLPPLSEGLARRSVADDALRVNFVPVEWHEREKLKLTQRRLFIATCAFLAVWLTLLAAFSLALNAQRKGVDRLKQSLSEIEGPAGEIRAFRDKILSFEQLADRTHSALECLREVTVLLPDSVDLNSFIYKKGGSLAVRGESNAPDTVYDYFQALEKSDLFVSAKAAPITSKQAGGRDVVQFAVTMVLPGGKDVEADQP